MTFRERHKGESDGLFVENPIRLMLAMASTFWLVAVH